jgi:hypothetical protein
MEICNNKKTGEVFIYLEEKSDDSALMITPHGDVKRLENRLFSEPLEVDNGKTFLKNGLLTDVQYEVYLLYDGER